LVLDASGAIVLANRSARELLRFTTEPEGRTPLEALRDAEIDAVCRAAATEGSMYRELTLRGPPLRVLGVRAGPLRGAAQSGVVVVFDDLTELRRLELVRRDFAANASHELRTPLTALQGFAETLAHADVPEPDRKRYLGIILQHAQRLAALVEDLLALSRVESKAVAVEASPLEIGPLAARVLEVLSTLFERRGVHAEVGPVDVPLVCGDARAVEQVLTNLLDNAAKYTEPGGRVLVTAERQGNFVSVSVTDTGIGIPEIHLTRIFERFYRVDKARSRDLGGTGLGLAIVRHLVETMGGRISVESTPGKGSIFRFTLPLADFAARM
ncbi:MAG TPA: ATP-binding protein, partial [Opitutaceae bacterium]